MFFAADVALKRITDLSQTSWLCLVQNTAQDQKSLAENYEPPVTRLGAVEN
jgi:hypothetical protein